MVSIAEIMKKNIKCPEMPITPQPFISVSVPFTNDVFTKTWSWLSQYHVDWYWEHDMYQNDGKRTIGFKIADLRVALLFKLTFG